MDNNGIQSQPDSVQHQPAETSTSPKNKSQTKLIILLLALMIVPNIRDILNPDRTQNIYYNNQWC